MTHAFIRAWKEALRNVDKISPEELKEIIDPFTSEIQTIVFKQRVVELMPDL